MQCPFHQPLSLLPLSPTTLWGGFQLSFDWNMVDHDDFAPVRPQFRPTKTRKNLITDQDEPVRGHFTLWRLAMENRGGGTGGGGGLTWGAGVILPLLFKLLLKLFFPSFYLCLVCVVIASLPLAPRPLPRLKLRLRAASQARDISIRARELAL